VNKIQKAIELALKEHEKEFGEGSKVEEDEEFATVFNDGIIIISNEEIINIKILAGKPYFVDYDLELLEAEK
jgi:hypothetical protein